MKEESCRLGCKPSQLDKALFRRYVNGHLEGVFVMYVDDFLYAGTENFKKIVITKIQGKGHVKIIFLPVIALSYLFFCSKLEQTLHKHKEQHS